LADKEQVLKNLNMNKIGAQWIAEFLGGADAGWSEFT